MSSLKKIISFKISLIIIGIILFFVLLIGLVSTITGVAIGYEETIRQTSEVRGSGIIINNQIYANRYRELLNKYLVDKGYVSLERLIFYLQRKNNILDITTLSQKDWEMAYLDNLNEKNKQMIPIKTICNNFKNDTTLSNFTIENGMNNDGVYIEVIDLCTINEVDITTSNDYSEAYSYLPFLFPLKEDFYITSMVFENRNVDLGLSGEDKDEANFHEGWDFAVPIGTKFYSICNGKVSNIVNTQFNDLDYKNSNNPIGNFIVVDCNNGLRAGYYHIQANSSPFYIRIGALIKEGDLLGKTSTTGLSTGPHLHLDLKNKDNVYLDALEYINFNYKRG